MLLRTVSLRTERSPHSTQCSQFWLSVDQQCSKRDAALARIQKHTVPAAMSLHPFILITSSPHWAYFTFQCCLWNASQLKTNVFTCLSRALSLKALYRDTAVLRLGSLSRHFSWRSESRLFSQICDPISWRLLPAWRLQTGKSFSVPHQQFFCVNIKCVLYRLTSQQMLSLIYWMAHKSFRELFNNDLFVCWLYTMW